MRKPTILRTLIFVLAMLFNFASYSQNGIAYNSKFPKNLNENIFLKANNQLEDPFSLDTNEDIHPNKSAAAITNPVIKYANAPYLGTVSKCPNDGKELPKLFLCGLNETRNIQTGIVGAQSIVWEKFNSGGSCTASSNVDCANETAAASCWQQVGTINSPDYLVNSAGQFRIRIVDNTGTPYIFYFNAYQNTLDLGAIAKNDIITYNGCTINGKISVKGFDTKYEYSLTTGNNNPVTWQSSNVFDNITTAANNYKVSIRLKGVSGTCVFSVSNIVIKRSTFAVTTTVTEPSCFGLPGKIKISTNDVGFVQYTYTISRNGGIVGTYGPTTDKDHTFDVEAGIYNGVGYDIKTEVEGSSCMTDYKYYVVVNGPLKKLDATLSVSEPLTACSPGKVLISASGGTTNYKYFVSKDGGAFVANSGTTITITAPGKYDVRVDDAKGCTTTSTIEIASNAKPEYKIVSNNSACYSDKTGISVNVTNSNGYTMSYSINNGSTFQSSPDFFNVSAGTYNVVVRYSITYTNTNGNQVTKSCTEPAERITISAPATALSASSGVGALSGCGVAPIEEIKGLVRVTNPRGGVPYAAPDLYRYSFDGGVIFGTEKEMWVKPGKYTLVIKDSNGCTFTMPEVTLDPKPSPPGIDPIVPVFNCDGTANSTVTINGGKGDDRYSYEYFLDGKLNTNVPSNVFPNVKAGSYTIRVDYKVIKVSTFSNLLEEDFGSGGNVRATGITEETSPGIENGYCFHDLDLPSTCANKATTLEDNQYVVTRAIIPNNSAWFPFRDHTSAGANPNGRFLAINIGKAAGANGVLYSKQINDVIPGQPIIVEAYLANLFRADFVGSADPSFSFELVDATGKVIAQQPPVPPTPNPTGIPAIPPILRSNKWELRTVSLDPGNNTSLIFRVISGSTRYDGNDGAIDDIKVYQLPRACKTSVSFPVTVDPAKAFTAIVTNPFDAQCNGQTNGGLTITAKNFNTNYGFDYSLDNGATWKNSKVADVYLNTLGAGNYIIKVRYDDKAGSCVVPLTQEIKAPPVLEVNASIKTPATCLYGATIIVDVKGGTPTYEYELKDELGTTTVRNRTISNEFTKVPKGTYTVVVYDKYNCPTAVKTTIIVTEPPKIDAVIANSSNLCYSPSNKASLVVSVTGGTAPFTYSLNGQDPQDSNTFKDLLPGSYIVTVKDINSCTQDTKAIVIEPELAVSAAVTQTLKCVTSPAVSQAVITGKIDGGRAPFGVTVFSGPGTGTIAYPTPTTFTFTGTIPGTYVFEISDSQTNVCKTTATATIKSLSNPVADASPENPKCFGAATGSVTLSGTLGSGAGYEYNFNNKGFLTLSTYTGLSAGITYSYQVKDGNGCVSPVKTFQLTQPTEVKGSIKATEIGCNGNNTVPAVVTVTATDGSGTYQYSFNNNTSYTGTNTFSTSVAGKVTAYIKDINGCEIGPLEITIGSKVLITALDIVSDSGLSCPANTATVTIKATGGSSPIKYKITAPTVSAENTDGIFAGLAPGTYTFQAIDKNGCNLSVDHTVSSSAAIKVKGTVTTPIKCFGDKGAIQYVVSGTTRFAYNIVNTANVSVGSNTDTPVLTINLNNLPASTYTITVTDKVTNCQATFPIDLTQPAAAIVVDATATKINCKNGKSDITVTVIGGTPNYSYAVAKSTDPVPTAFGPDAVLTVDTNLGANKNWIVYVKDANGCPGSFAVPIDSDPLPSVTAVLDNQCLATGTGNIFTITATGTGLAPLKYSIDGTNFQTGKTFNVSAGTYTVTVEDKNGCKAPALVSTVVSPQLTALATVTKELDCSPTTPDAQISVSITGGKGPYKYTVTKGTGTPSVQATITAGPILLPVTAANADKYTFVITDANLCSVTVDATVKSISNPTVSVQKSTNPSCDGGSDGSVELLATGGSGGGYQYSFDGSPLSSTTFYPGLAAGLHTFNIIDGKGCPSSGTITLTAPKKLIVTVVEKKFSCDTNSAKVVGTITLNVTAGTGSGPYEYSFNGGGAGSNVLTLNDTGADQPYTYTVTDKNGCSISGNGTLLRLNPPKIDKITGTAVTCINDKSKVTITTILNTGVGALAYTITSPATAITNTTGATSGEFLGLAPDNYSFKVTDENGCFTTGTFRVEDVVKITVSGSKVNDVKCFGDNTGAIQFTVGNYTTTFTYELKNSLGNLVTTATETVTNGGKTITYTGLGSDTFTFNVEDQTTGCKSSADVKIIEPVVLDLTAVATKVFCKSYDSKITVTPSGGTPNYTYAAVVENATAPTTFGANPVTVNTVNGTVLRWDVYVKDGNKCISKKTIEIDNELPPKVTATVAQCVTGVTLFEITASGTGVSPLTYSIDGTIFQTDPKFNVPAGTYTITVKDGNKCTAISTPIIVNPELTVKAVLTKDLTCSVPTDAIITVTVGGGKGPYTYQTKIGTGTYGASTPFVGASFPYNATDINGNSYQFLITDSNPGTACTVETQVVVTNKAIDPIAVTSFVNPTCNGFNDGSIKLGATGGVGPYEYSIDNGVTFFDKTTFGSLVANTYNYVIKDKNGCKATGTITITDPAIINPVITVHDIECYSDAPGSIAITSFTGGVGPFVYTLYNSSNTPIHTSASTTIKSYTFPNNLTFGIYYVGIVDANGCEFKSGKEKISTYPILKFLPPVISGDCLTGATVDLFLDTTLSSTPNYVYSIYKDPTHISAPTPATTYQFTGLSFGQTYYFQVKDGNGCESIVEVPIAPLSLITFTNVKTTDVTCLTTPVPTKNGTVSFTVSKYDPSVTKLRLEVLDQLSNQPLVPAVVKTVTITGATVDESFAGLEAGSYTLEAREVDGTKCSNSITFEISQPTKVISSAITAKVNANCNKPAQVTLTTTGGTGPYTYAVAVAPATPAAFNTGDNVLELSPGIGTDLNWNITVKDSRGCTFDINTTIIVDPKPEILLSATNCAAEGAFEITVSEQTAGVGTYKLSVDGNPFFPIASLPYPVTGLNSGKHDIIIEDANGCQDTKSITLFKKLTVKPEIKKEIDCTTNPDATITLKVFDGKGPFTYELNVNNTGFGTASAPFTAPSVDVTAPIAGTYEFRVTDNNLCVSLGTVIVDDKVTPDFTFDQTKETCITSNDGTITVTPTAGVGPFTYSINGGGFQTSNVFKNLSAGTAYNIVIKDAKECLSVSKPVTITEPLPLSALANITDPLKCTTGNAPTKAIVVITASGGTAPYYYSFDGGLNFKEENTFETYEGTTFDVLIRDFNGCEYTFSKGVDIPVLTPPKGLTFNTTVLFTCAHDATVEITGHTGGAGTNMKYETVAPSPIIFVQQPGTTFAGLTPGDYTFRITDENGCTYQDTHKVENVVNITVSGKTETNVSCNEVPAFSNGSVSFTVANFKGTYSYTLTPPAAITPTVVHNTGSDVITVSGLAVGTYQIDIKDDVTGCVTSTTADVGQPLNPLAITIESNTHANCKFGAKVTVKGNGGTPGAGYKYAFAANGATPVFVTSPSSVLDPSKTWMAYVIDANNCTAQIAIPIVVDPNPTIDSVSNVCYNDGPVTITLNGTVATGTGAPRYNIGNGWTYDNTFVLNAPGPYTFSIMDGNGCTADTPFNYTLNQKLLLTADLKNEITCKPGTAGDALIDLKATQGSLTYNAIQFSVDGTPYAVAPIPFTTNVPGTYTFRVTDNAGCEAVSKEVIVSDKTTPDFSYVKVDISCFGNNNGSIAITPSNGVAPYKYSIDGGTTYDPATSKFIGLTPGLYHVFVMDAKECVVSKDVTINEPAQLAVAAPITPFGCNTDNTTRDAVVTLNASAGTLPYSYSFDNGVTFSDKNTITVDASKTIKYVVVDKNGCRISGDAVVPSYNPPRAITLDATPIYCKTPGGFTTITVTSVTGPPAGTAYTYEIISPVGAAPSNNTGIFPNLLPNTYQIKVTDDASNCYTTGSIEVKKASEISVVAQTYSDVLCNGDSTGSITFSVSNYITAGAYSYTLVANPAVVIPTPTQVGDAITYSGLVNAKYTFTVTDNTSDCQAQVVDFLIDQPATPLTFTSVATDINCIKKTATITVTASGGTPGYKYAVLETGDTSTPVYGDSNKLEVDTNNGTKLSWVVYVKDLNNCPLQKTQTISTAPLPGGITIDPYSQCPDPTTKKYTFTVKVATGIAPFAYSLNGVDFQDDATFIVDASGTYTITVQDANGCTIQAATQVVIASVLQLKYEVKLPSCDENDGTITVNAVGGSSSANFVYTLDNNGFPQNGPLAATFIKVSSGAHFIDVLDTATGCTDHIDFVIKAATRIAGFKAEGTDVSCFGSTNGTITASITAGAANDNPDYTYQLFGTTKGSAVIDVNLPAQNSGSFENLKPGDYTVTVVSGRNCRESQFVRIAEPDIIKLDPPVVEQYACTVGNDVQHATVTVDKSKISGGSANYLTYQFIRDGVKVYDGPSNVFTETDFLGGKYIVNVIDSKGCIGTSLENRVFPFTNMDKISVVKTAITCEKNEDIVVTVQAADGTALTIPLNYSIRGTGTTTYLANNTNGKFDSLPVGTYLISVENTATSCIITNPYFVNDPDTFDLSASSLVNVKCYGSLDGSVILTMVDNVPPGDALEFTYTIKDDATNLVVKSGTSNPDGTITITGLKAGNYSADATLTGPSKCGGETSFTITQPAAALEILESHSPISCIPGTDGAISISAKGGWSGDYKYKLEKGTALISDFSDKFDFIGLDAGTYTLSVQDSKGCVATTSVKLDDPKQIQGKATATASVLSCFGDKNGEIVVSAVSGGEEKNYSYTLNILSENPVITSGPFTSNVFKGLAAGTYSITITDGLNCKGVTNEVEIKDPAQIVPTLVQQSGITCETQAVLTLTATGGTGTYEYSDDPGFATVLGSVPATFAVGLGDHQYYVRDTNGCVSNVSGTVTVNALTPLTLKLDLDTAIVYCKTEASASIDATAVGGLGNYLYSLLDGDGNELRPGQPNGYFDLLTAGNYIVHVVSGDCKYQTSAFAIKEPDTKLSVSSAVTDATCFAANDGKIVITASGGTGVIKYAISPNLAQFDDQFIFDRLAPGTYTVIVQDESGCLGDGPLTLEIKEPSILGANILGPIMQEICDGDKDGEFTLEIFGGRPPYSVSLDNENGTYTLVNGTRHEFKDLKGGAHKVFIKDATCIIQVDIAMDNAVVLNPTFDINYDCVNNTQSNMVTVTVDKSNTDLSLVDYALDNEVGPYQASNIFTNVAPGRHFIVARHLNGCKVPTASFDIKAYDPLTIGLSGGQQEMNIISVTAAGGAPAYEYSFNGEPFTSSNKYKIYKSGDYVVVVRDKNGCTATITIPAIYIDVCLDNYFTPAGATNTTWGPGCTNIYNNLEFSIFDRYGRVIVKYHYGQKWDGRYNGAELPSGDYWYVLKLNDAKDDREFVGHFTLYR